jgi:penicillin-binding protein 1A
MKTGTTNDAKDGWMTGFSTQYSAAVWVGYHNRTKAMTGTMEAMTQPIWQGWMQAAHKNLKPEDRAKPAGVQTLPAFVVRSNPGLGAVVPSTSTDLFPSWYKGAKAKTGAARTIDIVSNKSATDCTPTRARKDITDAAANSFSVDKFVTGSAASADTSQQDDVHLCTDVRPDITNISATKNGSSYHIVATVQQGTHPLSSDQFPGTLTFSIDGQILSGGSISVTGSGQYAFDYTPTFSGEKTVTATIVDSVLYDNIATVSITGSGSGGTQSGGPLTFNATTTGSGISKQIVFTWSGGTPNYDVTKGNVATTCMNQPGGGCSISYATYGSGTYKLTDENGQVKTVNVP